ncbi:MAG TPA: PilN domain-containing protein [Burkholderiales bacterium]|nr:PilN domain-containing protein [Burkholderiales bacterium]
MQRIELDFTRRDARLRWAPRVLLACALGLAGDMAVSYVQLTREVRSNAAIVARAEPHQPVANASAEEVAIARDSVERLGLPWARLFAALEAAGSDQVALLAIEPDTKNGTVKISGDSKDYLAALGYVLTLSQNDALSHVQLVHHEVQQKDPLHPVSFAISAAWNEVKR